MSCGSTTLNSTNNLEAPSPFPSLRRSWKIPPAWLAGIALGWERRYQRRQLLEKFDDHLLADIGLSRTAEEVRRSPLYLIAWRDSR
ncbi:DUF1127 domain-containing protein [Bradyrhizobium sp. 200]|uniref:DUF1127 domain-containing protein n=1 Tax=Bradyrhizobium sp. 200 TaxID=2782665 RepID=UPI001FFEB2C0|nr:DUF1127 domain-containing protein [Bradyrhizobium sp. 200]UPJ50551.1 DUF1127 domain-containing protein [Bradyrhizobium sp. 200]